MNQGPKKNRDICWLVLLIIQHLFFVLARLMDDLSWQSLHLDATLIQVVSLLAMFCCIVLKIGRKYCYQIQDFASTMKLYFVISQIKFLIPWSLTILNSILFYNIFGCHQEVPESEFLYLQLKICIANIMQFILTTLNYSFATNTKTQLSQLIFYQICLFSEIIYNGSLLVHFVSTLQGKAKDLSILFLSLTIANQMLVMDLMFRGAYEERVHDEELKVTIKECIELNNRHNAYVNSYTSD